jgi:DnaJ-class molecular chaperone
MSGYYILHRKGQSVAWTNSLEDATELRDSLNHRGGGYTIEEEEELLCSRCNGSGIGMYGPVETSKCQRCKGSGVIKVRREDDY